ncbi:PadR family transcriptional regulator [Cytobacillus oceanisediminis]|uniref:PadR family transcriptional regulator n=1 Tax=Cytobacillus oceanisediminis TaxID=665099 RepID=UPI00203E873E|nr:PadR family transcriptional regulator [Cytobacillus oceanisediminis]MCM3400968.1 PadR family transcriptional regulator [Cytobacillus oceanisediminis]
MSKELLKGNIDLLILSVVKEKESYGYEISKTIKEKTEGEFEIQEATLYLSLKRLEKQGAVSSSWGKESHGGRRKYYSITDEGVQLLENIIRDWKKVTGMVKRFI